MKPIRWPGVRFAHRFLVMVGGEGMQSALHFGLNIALLRMLPPQQYGVFAIVMVFGGLGLTYIRALTAMPAAIRIGRSRSRGAADAYDVTFGSGAFVLAVLIGLIVALVLRLWLGEDAGSAGLFCGLWALRSHLRTSIFAHGRATPVAIGDALFTLTGAALTAMMLFLLRDGNRLQGAFAVLTLANAVGIAAMLAALRRKLRISLRASVRRRYALIWRQLGWSAMSVTTANLQGQGMALLVATIAGPAAYAPIAAALVLFVPLRLIATAVVNLMQPILSRHLGRGETAQAAWQARIGTALLVGAALLYGAAMLAALPLIRTRVFDGTPMFVIGACALAMSAATMTYVMPRIILEIVSAFRAVTLITAAAAFVGMSMAAIILHVAAPAWSMLGAVASEAIVTLCCWSAMARVLNHSPARVMALVFGEERRPVERAESVPPT
jgi:O-antigen/teichoic acid export membrane protein